MVLYTVATVVKIEAVLMLLPLIVSFIYKEDTSFAFIMSMLAALVFAFAVTTFLKPSSKVIYAKEGFVSVALSWVALSIIGALPFFISGEIPSFVNAVFETVSGFTTTGASILENVTAMSKSLLFWRSFTHWLGGMGVLVFVLAISPSVSERSIHLLRAEAPGPIVGKLVPKMKHTARILYVIYIALTLLEFVFLLFGGMSAFESAIHAFGTAGTGGFGIKGDSVGSYSPYIQWVITVFMAIFGINFNLYYFALIKKFKLVVKNEELRVYVAVLVFSTAIIAFNIYPLFGSVSETIRHAAFQVSSIVTTTGFATTDFNLWPGLSKTIILLLMILGSCAGSTAGGFKISRVVLIFKNIKREFKKMLHSRSVSVIRLDGKKVSESTITSLNGYLAVYVFLLIGFVFIIGFEGLDIESTISIVVSCFNNIGPAFSVAGPMSNYNSLSDFSKLVLSFCMLLGRLEIIPMILTFSPSTWAKKDSVIKNK